MHGVRKLKIPVLMYHAISASDSGIEGFCSGQNIYTVAQNNFLGQLQTLAERHLASITISDLRKQWELTDVIGRNIILTFDDGYCSDYEIAMEALDDAGSIAHFFVNPAFVGKKGYVNWRQLREIADAGHIVGSHGMTHRYLSDLPEHEVHKELSWSRKIIEDKTGTSVTSLSLPGGRGGMQVLRLARKTGYAAVCTSSMRQSACDDGFLVLGRMPVFGRTSLREFRSMVDLGRRTLLRRRMLYSSKTLAARLIGNRGYDAVRDRILSTFNSK